MQRSTLYVKGSKKTGNNPNSQQEQNYLLMQQQSRDLGFCPISDDSA